MPAVPIPGSVDTVSGAARGSMQGKVLLKRKAAGLTDLMAHEAFDENAQQFNGGGNLKNVKTVNWGCALKRRSRSAAQPGAVAVVLAEGAISSTGATGIDAGNWCSVLSEPHPLPQPKHWCCEFRARW